MESRWFNSFASLTGLAPIAMVAASQAAQIGKCTSVGLMILASGALSAKSVSPTGKGAMNMKHNLMLALTACLQLLTMFAMSLVIVASTWLMLAVMWLL